MTDSSDGPGQGGLDAGKIGVLTATAVVVADMVGVGVFTSLGFQVKDIQSGFSLAMLWLVGGIVALCGAVCYAELGAMFPRSSGEYNLLARTFHPAIGFMAGWLSATVGFAAPVALAAMAFGSYANAAVPGLPTVVLGLGLIWIVTAIHLCGTRHGSRFQTATTVLKLALIVGFIGAGLIWGGGQPISFVPGPADAGLIVSAPFAISLVFVMYAYSGWNAATYIVGEVRDPQRNLPRALLLGTAIVVVLYVALNMVFLTSAPIPAMVGQLDVAVVVGKYIFGENGGRIVGAFICLGLIPTVSAMMWIGPRVTMAMGEDIPVLAAFSRRSRTGVPAVAILFQATIASLLVFTQSFDSVLEYLQFSLTFCSFLTVAGCMKMRITRPELPRPYRAWGYPVTPVIFLAVAGFMMYYQLTTRPVESLAGFATMMAGLLLYYPATAPRWQLSTSRATSK